MVVRINAKRVILRTMRFSDSDSLCRYMQDREISRWTTIPYPYKPKHALAFIKASRNFARHKVPSIILLGIELKETGEIIGGIGLRHINRQMMNAVVGCWIAKPYRGLGLMSEAMAAVLQYAFSTLRLKRVYAHIYVENTASQRMVKRCGFRREGCLRSSHYHHRHWKSSYLYAILSEDLSGVKARIRA